MNTAPTNLQQARQLPEMQPGSAFIVDWSVPVYHFLDKDNRLMRVVMDAEKIWHKQEDEAPCLN